MRTLALVGLLAAAACAPTERVAEGPIDLDATPKEVAFATPVVSGPRRDLCFEFETPGQSHAAAGIHVTLLCTDGASEAFVPTRIDRRGEALVCLCSERAPDPVAAPIPATITYRAAILSSEKPLRLRQIRWWSGPPR